MAKAVFDRSLRFAMHHSVRGFHPSPFGSSAFVPQELRRTRRRTSRSPMGQARWRFVVAACTIRCMAQLGW